MKSKFTSFTSAGLARKFLQSKAVASEIANRYGKTIPSRNGETIQLTPFVTMSNKVMGISRRYTLVGLPSKLKEFVESC